MTTAPRGDVLHAAFEDVAERHPGLTITFPATNQTLPATELAERSRTWARALLSRGVAAGEIIGLLVPTGPALPLSLAATSRAGLALSVMPTPRRFVDPVGQARKLARITRAAGMHFVIADPGYARVVDELRVLDPGLTVLDPAELDHAPADAPELPEVSPDALAIVQFTSGSTGDPKGVTLLHRTVLAGLRAIGAAARIEPGDKFVQWVPHFHDMGLFGWLSFFLHGGAPHIFRASDFISDPGRVLRYFAEVKATHIGGPNFSYDIITSAANPELVAELDLSSWKLAFNGAEPVNARTVADFTARLAPAGVRPSVMYPVYGMAEATLAITFPEPGAVPSTVHVHRELLAAGTVRHGSPGPGTKAVVGVGQVVPGIELRIVDEHGEVVGDDRLGEIQIAGEAVTPGYLRNPAANELAFDGRWLRTGDLGFTLDGELFVTGRKKEMIIVRGENFFPEDVEMVAREVPGVHRRRCVAFADETEDGAECVAVAVEAVTGRVDAEELAAAVRARVTAELGISPVRVHVLAPRSLPNTTSGKWQRGLTKQMVRADSA
ncbi:acyl-CoA synthetase (AMP-forming)/AMP-acid ligase II [Crossiella equi]|uniref:Acyl-CoA synthetase (AMP-forming)/AMP-acid ligase II n=1 Tax=Crossiella equi TaxID=130796 RepID=A0ABS5AT05_9PSEU|nr:AMP-binding protein [Crossiella equi]MBP2479357.1 acyl-CoA synthetase (AMP-forming)/AMP-acid ligase II [Crossiella equi]